MASAIMEEMVEDGFPLEAKTYGIAVKVGGCVCDQGGCDQNRQLIYGYRFTSNGNYVMDVAVILCLDTAYHQIYVNLCRWSTSRCV